MRVVEVNPKADIGILPGADFADAWRLDGLAAADALTLAGRAFGSSPKWIEALLVLRNLLVAPFGLKTGRTADPSAGPFIGIFPIISQRPDRVVMGLDDHHLDFRVVVEIAPSAGRTVAATATTYVRTHNFGGRLYMMVIKPFHRVIVRSMLSNAAARI
jgi:hypothetical protein